MAEEVLDKLIGVIYALPIFVLAFYEQLGLTIKGAFFIIIGSGVAVTLFRISNALDRGTDALKRGIVVKTQSGHSNPDEEEEEDVETSGSGAFAGMIVGGALGLPFGPLGIIGGGVAGAIIGDNIERSSRKRRKKKKEKKY